jgi:hypothetical protein
MIDKLETSWNEVVAAYFDVLSRHLPAVDLRPRLRPSARLLVSMHEEILNKRWGG